MEARRSNNAIVVLVIGLAVVASVGIYLARNVSLPVTTSTFTETKELTRSTTETSTSIFTESKTITAVVTSESTLTQTITKNLTSTTAVYPSIASIEITNISLNGWPGRIAVNPTTNRIYVADLFSNVLTVIDGSINKVMKNITLPGTIASGLVAVNPRTNRIYIDVNSCINLANVKNSCTSGRHYSYILVMDGNPESVLNTINMTIYKMSVNPNNNVLYAVQDRGSSAGSLLEINGSSNVLMANLSLNVLPVGIAVNPSKNVVYVSACQQLTLPCEGPQVLEIDGTTLQIESRIPLDGWGIGEIVINPITNAVYVNTIGTYLNSTHALITSINGTTGKVIAHIRLSAIYTGPLVLAVNSAQNEVYAASWGMRNFWIVDGTNYSVLNSFWLGSDAYGIALNQNTQEVYVATQSSATSGIVFVLGARFIVLP